MIIAQTQICDTLEDYSGVCNIGPTCGVGTKCENNPPCGSNKSTVPSCDMTTTDGKPLSTYAWTQISYTRTEIVCEKQAPVTENCICDVASAPPGKKICYCYKTIQRAERICDTNDKLQTRTGSQKDGYLVPGVAQCKGDVCGDWVTAGTVFYKVCCTPDGTVGHSGPYFVQDPYQPPEGVCIGGSQAKIMSSFTSDPGSLPNPGELHPDCRKETISCVATSTSPNTIRVAASTTVSSGLIQIKLGNQTKECSAPSCTVEFTNVLTAGVIIKANLIVEERLVASTTCSATTTFGGITPPQYNGTPIIEKGICAIQPYLKIVNIGENSHSLLSYEPSELYGNKIFNLKNSNIIQFDFGLNNIGKSKGYTCQGYRMGNFSRGSCCTDENNTYYVCRDACVNGERAVGYDQCGGCKKWDCPQNDGERNEVGGLRTTTGYDDPICGFGEGGGYVDISLTVGPIRKRWGLLLNTFTNYGSFRIAKSEDLFKKTFFVHLSENSSTTPSYSPERHGDYYVKVEAGANNLINVPAGLRLDDESIVCDVKCDLGNGFIYKWEADQQIINKDKSATPTIDHVRYYNELIQITSTDVIANTPSASSPEVQTKNNELSGKVKTPLRNFIVGYPININYGISLGNPGVFKKDEGSFWLEIGGEKFGEQGVQDTYGGRSSSYSFTPASAGNLGLCTVHNADDERSNPPNIENACSSITVYRYLCYQGFCYECPNEPAKPINGNRLNDAGCKVVEPVKCKTYIGSDCKSKGRE
ncbi:MAG: hypothetical protein QW472_04105 [Candidatus Aenigmatarchaeota archaeon]